MPEPDPWARPTEAEIEFLIGEIPRNTGEDRRKEVRRELRVPADVVTARGATIQAMTRDISRFGIGLLLRGPIPLGHTVVKMASDTTEYTYVVDIAWCYPVSLPKGMCMAGGELLCLQSGIP